MKTLAALATIAVCVSIPAGDAGKVEKLTFGSGGATRTYYLFVPEKASAIHAQVTY